MQAGHERARRFLKKSGANVLIWGTVIRHEGKSLPKLYWSPSQELPLAKESERYQPAEDLGLPEIFWNDLVEILRLLVITHDAGFRADEGRYVANRLTPFI
ncbi:MAG: hypothetical protein ACE5JS_07180, partial [Nitrospinota bacterium]